MGEGQGWLWEPSFNRSIKVRKADERLTGDVGLLLIREADHRLSLTADLARAMHDPRDPQKTRYTMTELLRQRLYALIQRHSAQDDLDCLAHDVAMRLAVWDRPGQRVAHERLASQPTHSRLIDTLAVAQANRQTLRQALAT